MRSVRFVVTSALGLSLILTGCASYNAPPGNAPTPPAPAPQGDGAAFNGVVRHGQTPIAGAHVYLFAANTTGYGKGSVSLLESAQTGTSDAIGGYVSTAADGSFAIPGGYSCTASSQVYLYALGGNTGSANNPAAGLLAALGNCTTPSKITINEATTVAAAYAMAGFATDATHVSSSGTPLAQTGIANAFANAASLAALSTGAAMTATAAGGVAPQSEIDTLANILASCVGAANSSSCTSLLATATADGTATGAAPTDTATAAINIAHHPGANVAALYTLSGASSTFTPGLTAQPNDFTVKLVFTVPNEDTDGPAFGSHPIAIDADGNVWVVDPFHNNVIKLASSGAFLSPAAGYTGGGLSTPQSIAIDNSGNAWIANYTFLNSAQQPSGTVVELSNAGAVLSPATGFGPLAPSYMFSIAIDASGNVWVPYGAGVAGLSSSGTILSAVANPPGAGLEVGGVAIDLAGNIWGAVPYGATLFNEFSPSGAIVNPPTAGQFSCGAPFEGEQQPEGVAIDASGDVWVTSGQGFTKESKSAIPACSGKDGGIEPLPEGVGGDIAIDGDGNAWVVNNFVLAEFSNSGVPLTPSTGYKGVAGGIALDGSGNLWATGTIGTPVGHFTSLNIFEFIGASAPVVTPIAAGLKNHMLGTRP